MSTVASHAPRHPWIVIAQKAHPSRARRKTPPELLLLPPLRLCLSGAAAGTQRPVQEGQQQLVGRTAPHRPAWARPAAPVQQASVAADSLINYHAAIVMTTPPRSQIPAPPQLQLRDPHALRAPAGRLPVSAEKTVRRAALTMLPTMLMRGQQQRAKTALLLVPLSVCLGGQL